jgi:hypothetical protein
MIERSHAGDEFVEHDAERPDIGRSAERLAFDLLGTRVGHRHRIDHGGRVAADLGVEQPRDAEIEQFGFAVAVDEDVGRLEIAMDDEPAVRILDRGADLEEQFDARAQGERMRVAPAVEPFAIDVFHGQERHAVGAAAGIDEMRDVRMAERGEDAPSATKRDSSPALGVAPRRSLSATRWRTPPTSRSASQTAPVPPSPIRSISA